MSPTDAQTFLLASLERIERRIDAEHQDMQTGLRVMDERLRELHKMIHTRLAEMQVDLARVRAKASAWGAVAAIFVSAVMALAIKLL